MPQYFLGNFYTKAFMNNASCLSEYFLATTAYIILHILKYIIIGGRGFKTKKKRKGEEESGAAENEELNPK